MALLFLGFPPSFPVAVVSLDSMDYVFKKDRLWVFFRGLAMAIPADSSLKAIKIGKLFHHTLLQSISFQAESSCFSSLSRSFR